MARKTTAHRVKIRALGAKARRGARRGLYLISVPPFIAERVPPATRFRAELTPEGILFRPVPHPACPDPVLGAPPMESKYARESVPAPRE